VQGCVLSTTGLRQGPVGEGSCEHSDVSSGSIKAGNFMSS
jgi:hypothetical protein